MPSGIFERTKEHNKSISESKKGIPRPDWVKKKISEKLKGREVWNKGKANIYSEATLRKMSETQKNNPKLKKFKKGHGCSKEIREKISHANIGQLAREKHHNWKGGITDERICMCYRREWIDMKESIRTKYKHICQNCDNLENGNKFHIHHLISFELKELRINPENLILLCKPCHNFVHSKKNINREFLEVIN